MRNLSYVIHKQASFGLSGLSSPNFQQGAAPRPQPPAWSETTRQGMAHAFDWQKEQQPTEPQQRRKKPKQEEAQGSNWLLPGLIGLGVGAAGMAAYAKNRLKPFEPFMDAWNSLTDENKERAKRLGASAAGGDLNKTIRQIDYVQNNPIKGGLYIAAKGIANKVEQGIDAVANKVKGWLSS